MFLSFEYPLSLALFSLPHLLLLTHMHHHHWLSIVPNMCMFPFKLMRLPIRAHAKYGSSNNSFDECHPLGCSESFVLDVNAISSATSLSTHTPHYYDSFRLQP